MALRIDRTTNGFQTSQTSSRLEDLPVELLSQIIKYLRSAREVLYLALTCRKLGNLVRDVGWSIFVRVRFPSFPVNGHWRDAARTLTTLSRNWDRKAFLARNIGPSGAIYSLPSGNRIQRWTKQQGQTMGYQPVIDSFEELVGNNWNARKQMLAWGAGAELVLRFKEIGPQTLQRWHATYAFHRDMEFDQFRHYNFWVTYRPPDSVEGSDDITALKIVKPHHCNGSSEANIIYGTHSGKLQWFQIVNGQSAGLSGQTLSTFATDGMLVRCIDLNASERPLLAAGFDDSTVAIYRAVSDQSFITPVSIARAINHGDRPSQTWATCFISNDMLAVGSGQSFTPLKVHKVTPAGLTETPLRSFEFKGGGPDADGSLSALDKIVYPPAVHCIAPLSSSQAGGGPGDTFFSGCYDGIVRLHDIRSPAHYEMELEDRTSHAPVFSLLALARERVVAGTGYHSVLVFYDLRMPGGRAYHYLNANPDNSSTADAATQKPYDNVSFASTSDNFSGWNCFLEPGTRPSGRRIQSPVYSLSSPSPFSPTIFVGIEANVVQLDFTGVLDKHPDPIYEAAIQRDRRGRVHIAQSWNPRRQVLRLAMYEQNDIYQDLYLQDNPGIHNSRHRHLDERWRRVRE